MRFKVASRVRGLSDEAFREAFGTEEQCRTALVRLRWPDGFVCPCCGHREHCVLAGRGLYQCNRCKKQTSPTAGTIFHATKLPLTLWFAAIHLIVTAKNGISSVEVRPLRLRARTATDRIGQMQARDLHGGLLAALIPLRRPIVGADGDGTMLSLGGAASWGHEGPRRGGHQSASQRRRCANCLKGRRASCQTGDGHGLPQGRDR